MERAPGVRRVIGAGVMAIGIAGILAAGAPPPPDASPGEALKAVERRYNSAATLKVRFEHTYSVPSRGRRTERGELFLRKPGRMRWEYSEPPGKLFVSDGKDIYFFSPSANRVEKSRLKETGDFRAPLGFLLGRLDFSRDFRSFRSRPAPDGLWIAADPKSDRLPYKKVEFLISPRSEIRHLLITDLQNAVIEFRFDNEARNPPLSDALFRFRIPPGAEFVESNEARER